MILQLIFTKLEYLQNTNFNKIVTCIFANILYYFHARFLQNCMFDTYFIYIEFISIL